MSPGPLGELYAGVHAENPDALTDTPPQRPIYGDRTDATGNLAQLSPEAAAKALVKLWDEREKMYGRERAQWQVNAWRREGIVHAEVQRAQDRDEWIAWRWGGGIPHLNKAATLCRKLAATVWADLPVAVVAADTGEDADRDAAQFSERVLHFLQDAAQLDDITQARRAFDLASTYGSTFRHYYLEPRGERLPIQIEATASAQSAQEPFGPGQVVPAEPLVLRYVQPDGSLRDDKAGAAEHPVGGPRVVAPHLLQSRRRSQQSSREAAVRHDVLRRVLGEEAVEGRQGREVVRRPHRRVSAPIEEGPRARPRGHDGARLHQRTEAAGGLIELVQEREDALLPIIPPEPGVDGRAPRATRRRR